VSELGRQALGRALHRPTIFPLPGFAARLVLGEMAEALLLASQRVEPRRLLESGYRFRRPEIDGALKALLG
jgi:NAD dependent epimerase/dehydratase family enzyme